MKKKNTSSKFILPIFITFLLLYVMKTTTSPKIIFVPFLICSISKVGQNIAMLLNKKQAATVFYKLFSAGVLLFIFGFLIFTAYLSIRDKNYSMLLFSAPFWVGGVYFLMKRLSPDKYKNGGKNSVKSPFAFPVIITVLLVLVALLAGIIILILGIMDSNIGLIFAGAFFVFGAFTFVLFALTIQGFFDNAKIDVLGMYMGVLIAVIGIGIIAVKYAETYSLGKTIEAFGLWLIVPLLMFVFGAIQIIKCLKGRKGA